MKKLTLIALSSLFFAFSAYSQEDFGYKTFDIGLEYKWAQKSPGINLQMAFNSKLHHSFLISIGFKNAYNPIEGTHDNEKGRGWGGSLGYRYYFSVVPKGFFLGVRCDLWSMRMYHTANASGPSSNVLIAQPSGEIGYTILINDQLFITLFASGGKQFTVSSSGEAYKYGQEFIPGGGISVGWRF